MRIILFVMLIGLTSVNAQRIHHQMISSQGNSIELYNGLYISQTIGQQSVIGNYARKGCIAKQGYQQILWKKYINKNLTDEITTIAYPNPFIQTVNFKFSKPINETISIAIFDVRGRLICQQEKKAKETILTIELEQLPASNYLVYLSTLKYTYYTQILKQQ